MRKDYLKMYVHMQVWGTLLKLNTYIFWAVVMFQWLTLNVTMLATSDIDDHTLWYPCEYLTNVTRFTSFMLWHKKLKIVLIYKQINK